MAHARDRYRHPASSSSGFELELSSGIDFDFKRQFKIAVVAIEHMNELGLFLAERPSTFIFHRISRQAILLRPSTEILTVEDRRPTFTIDIRLLAEVYGWLTSISLLLNAVW
ncbi:MAG: hypothetical protein R3C56_08065 [Pirellulaceae bacterium]